MSSFLDALIVERLDAPQQWEVVQPFRYEVGALGSGLDIVVPAHFPTDFASIPRPLWWLWPPVGASYDKAAALHDYLYRTQFANIERVVADAIFLEAMTVLGVPRVPRHCIYTGVRLFGWITYRRYRRAALEKRQGHMTLNINGPAMQAAIAKSAADAAALDVAKGSNKLAAEAAMQADGSGTATVSVDRTWRNGWDITAYAQAWWTGETTIKKADASAGVKVTKSF